MRALDAWMSASASSRLSLVSAVWRATSSTVSAMAADARASSSVVADACVTAAFCWMVVAASSSDEAESTAAAEFTSVPDCRLSSAIARNLRASLVPKRSAAAAATTAPRATTTTARFRWLLTGARTVAALSSATMPQLRSLTVS